MAFTIRGYVPQRTNAVHRGSDLRFVGLGTFDRSSEL